MRGRAGLLAGALVDGLTSLSLSRLSFGSGSGTIRFTLVRIDSRQGICGGLAFYLLL